MSVPARNWANVRRTGSKNAKAVLLILADAAMSKPIEDGQGHAHQCTLSEATIVDRTEIPGRTVQRALNTLDSAGLVLRKFGSKGRWGRSCSTFFLNVDDERIDSFAGRCGVTWRARVPSRQGGGKEKQFLAANSDVPIRHGGVASTLNRETHRERARARRTELQEDWSLPDEWLAQMAAEFEATPDQIRTAARKFHNHYRNRIAKPKDRTRADWLAELRHWCFGDFTLRKGAPARGSTAEHSDETWSSAIEFWQKQGRWNDRMGPRPDEAGCRVPLHLREKFGLGRVRQAA